MSARITENLGVMGLSALAHTVSVYVPVTSTCLLFHDLGPLMQTSYSIIFIGYGV